MTAVSGEDAVQGARQSIARFRSKQPKEEMRSPIVDSFWSRQLVYLDACAIRLHRVGVEERNEEDVLVEVAAMVEDLAEDQCQAALVASRDVPASWTSSLPSSLLSHSLPLVSVVCAAIQALSHRRELRITGNLSAASRAPPVAA